MIGKLLTRDWLLEHADQKVFDRGMAYYIRSMMRDIVEKEGSLDEKIAFLAGELDWPGHYRKIADLCLSYNRLEEAGQWLDKGLAVFKGRESQDLPWKRAELHILRKEYTAAEELAWKTFVQRKDYESWKEVRKLSGKIPEEERSLSASALEGKAVDMLSSALKEWKKDDMWTPCDALVRIYLDRDDAPNAWVVAENGRVSAPLLIAIAEKIRKTNPNVSIRIHKQMVDAAILPMGRRAYEEAMTHVRKLKDIMDAAQFVDYIGGLRSVHKQKKLLMEMLDKI